MQSSLAVPRLSVMMFLQFFLWGSWYVTAPSFLGKIGFKGADIGWTYSVGPIAGMISPLFVGMVADRFFSAQRVLGVLHLLGAALMYYATTLMRVERPDPDAINWVFFGHMLCYFPTLALTNTLAMRNVQDSEKQFPMIRVFGTIGWIVAGVSLVGLGMGASIGMFQLAAITSAVLGVYAFTLPATPPTATGRATVGELLGFDAFKLLKDRNYLVFMVCSFLICIPLAFYYQLAERGLQAAGVADTPLKMSFGQGSEVFFMAVMPFFFARLGVKWMLAVGMAAWVIRYGLFAWAVPNDMAFAVLLGVLLHGICYDFFFVTGQIYTDQKAPTAIRGQAQGLLVLFTLGLGMFLGAKIGGEVEGAATSAEATRLLEEAQPYQSEALQLEIQLDDPEVADRPVLEARKKELDARAEDLKLQAYEHMDWQMIWQWPAAGALAVLLLFLALFRERRAPATETPEN